MSLYRSAISIGMVIMISPSIIIRLPGGSVSNIRMIGRSIPNMPILWRSTTDVPHRDGLVEKLNKTLKQVLGKMVDKDKIIGLYYTLLDVCFKIGSQGSLPLIHCMGGTHAGYWTLPEKGRKV